MVCLTRRSHSGIRRGDILLNGTGPTSTFTIHLVIRNTSLFVCTVKTLLCYLSQIPWCLIFTRLIWTTDMWIRFPAKFLIWFAVCQSASRFQHFAHDLLQSLGSQFLQLGRILKVMSQVRVRASFGI
ncbi:hypothetical protein KC19_5G118600 [Ceratodon purpureus]|uniref:Uncharacterized protein n=1 Tax=Ceratodon purpureus TaxID=3225 RepID=A0A8T0I1C1_CERPU|nr:hypothetical protein KC19_5G118600 [Ceratodon purpureus]